jgi:DNA primase
LVGPCRGGAAGVSRERIPVLEPVISESFKQELLARVDIVDVIDARVPLKKAGANYSARCPFHTEKTPSFSVSPSKQFYHCFGCGAHGNAISFLMEYGGLGYVDAVRELADSVGMKMPAFEPRGRDGKPAAPLAPDLYEVMAQAMQFYREQLKRSPRAIDYLKSRGLTGKIAARFGIGYAPDDFQGLQAVFPKYDERALVDCGLVSEAENGRRYDRFRDRVMFPIINPRGQVIGFGGRVIGAGEPKYLNSPETALFEKRRELYGLREAREAIRATDRVVVVEGYMDVVALAQHGVENAVATLGTATTPNHVTKLLRQASEIVFCFDGDAAGRKAAWHALDVSLGCLPDGKTIRFLLLPTEHDPDSFVRAEGEAAFVARAASAEPLSAFFAAELTSRHAVTSAEGRAQLVTEARPLLQKMVAPALQLQLVKEFARLADMTPEELGRLIGLQRAEGPLASALRRTEEQAWRPAYGPARANAARAQLVPERRLERKLLQALLANPELGAVVPVEYSPTDYPEGRALAAVLDALRQNDLQNDGAASLVLMERLRASPHRELLEGIEAELMDLQLSADQAASQLRGALLQVEILGLRERIRAFEERDGAPGLNADEQRAYLELIRDLNQRRTAVQQALGGNAGVV